jgi:tetratricopeptide (TPR) repeat protein
VAHTTNEPWSEPVALARVAALTTVIQLLCLQDKITEARPYAEELLLLDERLGDNPYRGRTYHALGLIALTEGDYAAARDWLLKGIAALQGPDDAEWLSASLWDPGDEAYFRSDYSEAQRWYTECVALTRQRGDKNLLAYPLRRLGYIAIQQGELDKAEAFIAESLSNNLDIHEMGGVIGCLAGLAAISLARAEPVRAVTLCGCVGALLAATHKNLFPVEKKDYERCLSAARAQLDEATFNAAWEAGRPLTFDQAIDLALKETD